MILVSKKTRVLVQGITGHQGSFHTKKMLEYNTKVVAGVTPGKGGKEVFGVPVFDTVEEALDLGVTSSIIFVPAPFVLDAALEAITFELNPVVIITEHVPIHDSIKIMDYARKKNVCIVGPNTPGIITPEECKMGIMPTDIFKKGEIGVISRSGTLTYEIVSNLTNYGFGQSTAIGIGGDPIVGLSFIEVLEMFEKDSKTKACVLIGEIGGNAEEKAAEYIGEKFTKPVVSYVAGRTAPKEKRMGHAGAVITGKTGTAKSKIKAFEKNGVRCAKKPSEVPKILSELV